LLRVLYRLAQVAVFNPMLRKAGLSRIQAVLCAGAALPRKVQALWEIWGVNVRNLYGITEGGYALCQTGRFPKPGDVGRPIFPQEPRCGADREILLQGKTVFRGYWQNEAATRAAVVDGFLQTGDVVEVDSNGDYRIVDRKKDIMITSGGKNIAPTRKVKRKHLYKMFKSLIEDMYADEPDLAGGLSLRQREPATSQGRS